MANVHLFYAMASSPFVAAYDATPAIKVAYGLRRMVSSYTGAIIRVQNKTTNASVDIGYLPNGDLDSEAILAFTGSFSNASVTMLYAQVGGTAANAPLLPEFTSTLVQYGARFLVYVRRINIGADPGPTFQTGFSPTPSSLISTSGSSAVSAVYRAAAGGGTLYGGGFIHCRDISSGINSRSHNQYASKDYINYMGLDRYEYATPLRDATILNSLSLSINATTSSFYLRGLLLNTSVSAFRPNVNIVSIPDCYYVAGDIGDYLIFERELTATEHLNVNNIQQSYYGYP